jgi:hypothetical protein
MKDLAMHAIDTAIMCGRLSASFEFREIKVRYNLQRDLPFWAAGIISRLRKKCLSSFGTGERTNSRSCAGAWSRHGRRSIDANRMINARAETITDEPSFRRLLESRRCLVSADGL